MTNARPPRPDPASARPRPGQPYDADAASTANAAGTARIVAVVAIVIAVAALGLTVWRVLFPGSERCQTAAWDTMPSDGDLPQAWTLSATQYDLSRKTMSYVGPVPEDPTVEQQGVIYATITCFEEGAAESVTRSAQAARDAGQSVVDRKDLGDGGFTAVDASNATFLQLRHGKIVVYLAASGDALPEDVDQLASAFDKALGGDGGAPVPPTPEPPSGDLGAGDSLDPGASDVAESPAAPDLVARIPETVGDITLASESLLGPDIPGIDGSRAILAALADAGRQLNDLRLADAYDVSGVSDLEVQVITVDGMPIAKTKALVLDSWLSASGAGVTHDKVTFAGKEWERIDYGDEGPKQYVRVAGDDVIVITTSDPSIAEQTAAAIK